MLVHLLEFREKLKNFYSKYDRYLLSVIRFLFALGGLLYLSAIGRNWTSGEVLPFLLLLVLALVCAFLPSGMISFVFAAVVLLQMFSVSVETFLVAAVLFVLMVLLYFSFRTHNSVLMAVALILYLLRIPQALYLWIGLFYLPYVLIPTCFGLITGCYIQVVAGSLSTVAKTGGAFSVSVLIQLLNSMFANQELYFQLAAAVVTTMVVYVLRRCAFRGARYVSVIAGGLVYLLVRLSGMLFLRQTIMMWSEIALTVVAVALVMLLSLLVFAEDYSRVEYAQFEDDDYYYYVKAVPKMTVALSETKVKKINRQVQSKDMDETKSFTPVK